jgi:hypothetical protein
MARSLRGIRINHFALLEAENLSGSTQPARPGHLRCFIDRLEARKADRIHSETGHHHRCCQCPCKRWADAVSFDHG